MSVARKTEKPWSEAEGDVLKAIEGGALTGDFSPSLMMGRKSYGRFKRF